MKAVKMYLASTFQFVSVHFSLFHVNSSFKLTGGKCDIFNGDCRSRGCTWFND